MNSGFEEAPTVCQQFSNRPGRWMLLLMVFLSSSMSHRGGRNCLMILSRQIEVVSPINCPPGVVVVVTCHDDYRRWKVFLIRHGSWNFAPHLMHNGGATRIVAMWHILASGINAPIVWLLGFSAKFQFFVPWFLNFSTPYFPFHFSQIPNHCSECFLFQPFSAILLWAGAWLCFLHFLLRYVFLLMFYFFSLFGVDINYGEFMIFSPFSFVFVFGFRGF